MLAHFLREGSQGAINRFKMKKEIDFGAYLVLLGLILMILAMCLNSCIPARVGEKKDRYTLSRGMWGGQP